jgi:Bacterial Ig domain
MVRAVLIATALLCSARDVSATRASSRTIFLNRNGASLRPGINDARAQTSSLVSQPINFAAWSVSNDDWVATVECMTDIWSRFDVELTDIDPGSVPHIEALLGGSPSDLGLATNLSGIAPFADDCSVVENSIVFTFTDKLPKDPRRICEVMSQEIGHSYGLDHEVMAADPMSQLAFARDREFQDADAACGETIARPCHNGCRTTQNSVQILRTRLGAFGGDDVPPALVMTSPTETAVTPGFTITLAATDNVALASITLSIDGVEVGTTETSMLELADPGLATGHHTLHAEASDDNGNVTTQDLDVVVETSAGCSSGGASKLGIAVVLLTLRRRRTYT